MRNFLLLVLIIIGSNVFGQSGGALNANQAAYDVKFYELDIVFDISYTQRSIDGSVLIRTEIIDPIDTLELDLWNTFTVDSVLVQKNDNIDSSMNFVHANKKLKVRIPGSSLAGDIVSARVYYHGTPRTASYPPWDDGFTWRLYSNFEFMIGVTCETEGADVWMPCKDHPSDEPDSVSLHFTVPDTLDCISNGQLKEITYPTDSTTTFHWYLASPINNYNITFYITQYELLERNYWSDMGDSIPMNFWVKPGAYESLEEMIPTYRNEFSILEQAFGPFPFLTEKLGFVQSSYAGMEHQTCIAYGSTFNVGNWGYDYIHYHELAHEWWGNFVTAKDWADVWIHEGMATYAEALFVEQDAGIEDYMRFMRNMQPSNNHSMPLAPRETVTAQIAFDDLNPYWRGASVIHTLRYHLGDEAFKNLLKRWAYPDSLDLDNTNGRQCRIMTTDDMMYTAEEITGRSLELFFEVFFREVSYPQLIVTRESDYTSFEWTTETNVPLDLNVPVTVNGVPIDVEMSNGVGELAINSNDTLKVDPQKWILMRYPQILVGISSEIDGEGNYFLSQNYPNPMDYSTIIRFKVPAAQRASIRVFNALGQYVTTIIDKEVPTGMQEVELTRENLNPGLYFYTLSAGSFSETRQFIIR